MIEENKQITSEIAIEATNDDKKSAVKKPAFLQAIGRRKESVARVKLFKNGFYRFHF